ncbi:MAG: hypothetical protein ACR2KF_08535 [Nitrososphaeraceae archaeon]
MMNSTLMILIILLSIAVIFLVISMFVPFAKSEGILEDEVMICVQDIWTHTASVICKIFDQDDIGITDEMDKIYNQFRNELDTFGVEALE